jgi:hypothetical protein
MEGVLIDNDPHGGIVAQKGYEAQRGPIQDDTMY